MVEASRTLDLTRVPRDHRIARLTQQGLGAHRPTLDKAETTRPPGATRDGVDTDKTPALLRRRLGRSWPTKSWSTLRCLTSTSRRPWRRRPTMPTAAAPVVIDRQRFRSDAALARFAAAGAKEEGHA